MVTIVTAATNVREGQVVPVSLDGSKLVGGKVIRPTNFRGIESDGMLCSADELIGDTKLIPPDQRDGIFILPPDTPVGVDVKPIMGLDDVVLEFELTANRADCFSMIGIAREVAALTGGQLKRPLLSVKENAAGRAKDLAGIKIEDPDLCGRFVARVFTDVRIGPSPAWMQHRLQAAGMRPINNVVDVTNFVMLEMCRPFLVSSHNRPSIRQCPHFVGTQINHRFYCKCHSRF